MPVRTHRVPLSDRVRAIDVHNPTGSVTVRADPGATELVVTLTCENDAAGQVLDSVDLFATKGDLRVVVPDRRLVRSPRMAVQVLTPPDAPVAVTVGSADVELHGRLGATRVTLASGDLQVERCASLQVRSASGDVHAGTVTGDATVTTASGDVHVGTAGGTLQVSTATGDVTVGEADGDVGASTATGDIVIARARRGTVRLKTVSADATVAVDPGLRLWLDVQTLTGRLRSDLDDDGPGGGERPADLSVFLQSVSGDLRLRRAVPAPPPPPAPPAPPVA